MNALQEQQSVKKRLSVVVEIIFCGEVKLDVRCNGLSGKYVVIAA